MKRTEQVRIHKRTAPYWDRLRAIIEKMDEGNEYREERRKDTEILDMAVHCALTVLDPDPAHAMENSTMHELDGPMYIIPKDEEPKEKIVPIRPPPTAETLDLMARLEKLEANVSTIMEKNE